MYTIEELIVKFTQHAEQADRDHQDWKKAFEINHPGQMLPDHLSDDFNLPRALASICTHLLNLKI